MQSILQVKQPTLFPKVTRALGPQTVLRQKRMLLIYTALYLLGAIFVLILPHSSYAAFGHSLVLPGSGFLGGWGLESGLIHIELGLFFISLFLLGAAGFLWFATGNVILPPLMWAVIAIVSGLSQTSEIPHEFDPWVTLSAFGFGPSVIAGLSVFRLIDLKRAQARRARLNQSITLIPLEAVASEQDQKDELSLSEVQHMRLLLDRAMQPVDEFEGFEWQDQFQTAAVRYQINSISYALSMAQAHYMPDFTGYLSEAQQKLKAKQENHRIWKYWKLENIWGNLRKCADPIVRDNIMYSGFVGAQLAYSRQAGYRDATALDGLTCRAKGSEFAYTQDEMMQVLTSQYEDNNYGLLSCEPNWVYPLCNAISATAIRAQDTQNGTQYWEGIKDKFRHALETEFITPHGKFIPFRSNYTGFAPPQIGGAVMQAFPCFFLNAILPDIARRQWQALKLDMKGKSWRRVLWPADVGNYNLSRASSYAATALAAREMGDDETAELLLQYLAEDCPLMMKNGIAHYSKASLWANANAFMARIAKKDGLRTLVTTRRAQATCPYLAQTPALEVLIAKAKANKDGLSIVAYPAQSDGYYPFKIAGLAANQNYKLTGQEEQLFTALPDGTHTLTVHLSGRTEFNINPIY